MSILMNYDVHKTALLVIDMQNDFVKKGSMLEVKSISPHLASCKKFIDACKKKGMLVIYTAHIFDPISNPIEAQLFSGMAQKGLRDNTSGADICDELSPCKNDVIIKKRRYDAFIGTNLELLLRSRGIETVIIIGTMTNVCCESTARTAMMKDFRVLFCSDLTFTHDAILDEATLKNINSHFGYVLDSKKILQNIT